MSKRFRAGMVGAGNICEFHVAAVKALLMELVDWDFELERLLDEEVPPFDLNTDPDHD